MAQDVGTLYYKVMPSARGFGKTMESQAMSGVTSAGSTLGKAFSTQLGGSSVAASATIGKAFGNISKIGLGTISGIGASLAGLAAKGGFDRALSIQTAQTKLKGLHHDAADIQSIMNSALESVRGTAYGLGDAATVAASLSASGIKSGEEMTHVLKSVADTAAISGKSLTDVGAIFGSVAARGKLQGDDMLQLTSAGVPVLDMLAKHLGTTSQAVSDMVSKGKIDFATFADAMEENMGGAALATGDTFNGAMANIKAALGRLGAAFELPLVNQSPKLFQQVAKSVDQVTSAVTPLADTVAKQITPAFDKASAVVAQFASGMQDGSISLKDIVGTVAQLTGGLGLLAAVGPNVGKLASTIQGLSGKMNPSFGKMKIQLADFTTNFSASWKKAGDAANTLGLYLHKSTREAMATEGDSIASGIVQLSKGLERINEPFMNAANKLANTNFGQALGTARDGVINGLENVASAIQNGAASVYGKANNALAPISDAINSKLGLASNAFANNPIIQKIGAFKAQMTAGFSQLAEGATTALGGLAPKLQSALTPLSGIASKLGSIFNPATLLSSFGFGAIAAGIVAGLGMIELSTNGQISNMVAQLGAQIPQLVQQINGFVQQQLPGVIAQGSHLITTVLNMISQQAPALISSIGGALTTAVNELATQMPTLTNSLIQALASVIASIVEQLPSFLAAGSNLLTGLVQGIMNALPNLITTGSDMVQNLMAAIQTNLPTILNNGVQIVQMLVNGIIQNLPLLIQQGMQLIPQVGSAILSMLPQIIEAGVNILVSLVNGLAQALPQLIAYAPILIIQLASQLIANLPNIISAGARIISSIMQGLSQMIPALIGMIPAIARNIINAFKSTDWGQIGKNIIDGIVNGVKSFAGHIFNAVKNVAGGALDAVKGFLGIHSPSRVFRDQVGVMIGRGLALGIAGSNGYVQDSMTAMAGMVANTTIPAPQLEPFKQVSKPSLANIPNGRVAYAAEVQRPVTQNFDIKVVRSSQDLYSASSIMYRNAVREARNL